jgi:hypothetical protein
MRAKAGHWSRVSNPKAAYEQSSIQSVAVTGRQSALEVGNTSIHRPSVSKVEQMEAELRKLSQTELCQIREWLDDMIEDQLPFTPEFERSIQQAERDMTDGLRKGRRSPIRIPVTDVAEPTRFA